MDDYRNADLDPPVRALMDFAVALTLRTNGGGEPASTALRDAGWGDESILEAVEIVGFFNYYNRLVDALGVAPEPDWGEHETLATSHPAPARRPPGCSSP